jgi:hypothetical protein
MMKIDTMIPAEKVWCILHPLPGNAAGTTSLFINKATTTFGSDSKADFILRHPKVSAIECAIVSGSWEAHRGSSGYIQKVGKAPIRFAHKSTIQILDDPNGTSAF